MLKVRPIRKRKGLTQIEVAEMANITQSYLSEIETGKADPTLSALTRLAKALGVSIKELVED